MRWLVALGLALVTISPCFAQMPRLTKVVEGLLSQDEPPPVMNPTDEKRLFRLESADEVTSRGDDVALKGNVRFRFREFTVTCDEATGNVDTEIFDLVGNVLVSGPNLNYEGKRIRMNFKDETAEFVEAKSTLKPEVFDGRVKENLYIRGASGTGSEKRYTLDRGTCTTCGLPHPHYHLSAKRIDVFTGDRLVMRDAKLEVLGTTVLRVPYLSVPLDERTPRYIPETGQSPDEGYFVKTRWGVGVPGDELLDARLDLMSKLGMGVGSDLRYRDGTTNGTLRIYGLIGPQKSVVGSLVHGMNLGSGRLSVNADYSQRNYLTSPQNTQINIRNLYSTRFKGGDLRFAHNRLSNRASDFSNQTENFQLIDTRTLGDGYRTSVDLNFSTSTARSGTFEQNRKVLDVRTRAEKRFSSLDAELSYQRTVPISEIVNFFSATDQTPMFSLRSDASRLFGNLPKWVPNFSTAMSIGELVDGVLRRNVTRSQFDFTLPQTSLSKGIFDMSFSGRFRQNLYSDNTAQFVLGFDSQGSLSLGEIAKVNLRYNHLRPQGFTPLAVDRTGRTDFFGADVSIQPSKSWLVAAQSGFDVLARDRDLPSSWQSLGLRVEYKPSEQFQVRTSGTYDTFNQIWSAIRVDSILVRGATKIYLGSRFDAQRHTWGAVNLIAEGLRWGRLSTNLLLAYNGYTQKFESRQFSFTYDMHCSEALLEIIDNQTGFRNGTTIGFYIRLKALPFATPFGRGTRGQGFGTSTGFGF